MTKSTYEFHQPGLLQTALSISPIAPDNTVNVWGDYTHMILLRARGCAKDGREITPGATLHILVGVHERGACLKAIDEAEAVHHMRVTFESNASQAAFKDFELPRLIAESAPKAEIKSSPKVNEAHSGQQLAEAIRKAHVNSGAGDGVGDPLQLLEDIVVNAQSDLQQSPNFVLHAIEALAEGREIDMTEGERGMLESAPAYMAVQKRMLAIHPDSYRQRFINTSFILDAIEAMTARGEDICTPGSDGERLCLNSRAFKAVKAKVDAGKSMYAQVKADLDALGIPPTGSPGMPTPLQRLKAGLAKVATASGCLTKLKEARSSLAIVVYESDKLCALIDRKAADSILGAPIGERTETLLRRLRACQFHFEQLNAVTAVANPAPEGKD